VTTSVAPEPVEEFSRTPLFEVLARAGYAARGVLYAIVGVLAYRLAEGTPSQPASQRGVFLTIADQPFGRLLLVLTIIGLLGYATWRIVQAAIGRTPEAGRQSAIDRIAALGSGVAYAMFAVLAISIVHDSTSDSPSPQELSQRFIEEPWGRAVVGITGAVFVVMAAYQVFMGVSRRFCDDSKVGEMGEATRRLFVLVGVVGLLARGVVFGLIGFFALRGAIQLDRDDAVGVDGALTRVLGYEHGAAALTAVAVGLVVFGAYSLMDARYRKI
jgi:hypothetical protein